MPGLLKRLRMPPGAKKALDLGGSHGEMAKAIAAKYPGVKATVMDLPGPLETARTINEEEGDPYRIDLEAADVLVDPLGSGWDLVLLSQFIHCFGEKQNRDIFRRVHESLNPGGAIVILDQFEGLGRVQDYVACLVSVGYFTIGGKTYHRDEVEEMLSDAGFERIAVKRFPKGSPTALVEGWKR
jgi:cyclopropane fatty-acyl-phospholipid synthase-like methyltransferase